MAVTINVLTHVLATRKQRPAVMDGIFAPPQKVSS
jgi:hypothetical protein